jgi:2-keto-4-pentenoate hydratase
MSSRTTRLTRPADDARVARGMRAQLALRRERLAAGDRPLGWKVGFGSPAAMERLETRAPLVGFLTRRALVRSGGTVSVGGWTSPVAEPELALYLPRGLTGTPSRAAASAAVGAIGPAIELADVDRVTDDPEEILARNIYQRAVVLGPTAPWTGSVPAGLRARVARGGAEVAATDDVEALTGDVVAIVVLVADVLTRCREHLAAGDVVIAGSIVPPLAVVAGDELVFALEGLGDVAVSLTT